MILVTLGTQDKPFVRLLEKIDEQVKNGNISEEIIVQAGCTKYNSDNMKIFDLVSMEQLDSYIDSANLIITHGGVGSIISSLKKGKRVIACARLKKYGEHTNDHQLQIINNFSREGYILSFNEDDALSDVLLKARDFVPKKFISNTENFLEIVDVFIKKTFKK